MFNSENRIEFQPIFKFYNYIDLIHVLLVVALIGRALDVIFFGLDLWLFIIILFLAFYLFSLYFLNCFCFYTDRLVVFYPTRLFNRKVVFHYSEISKIKFTTFRYSKGFRIILKNKLTQSKYSNPQNSFSCPWQKKKKIEFIDFLDSKCLEVEHNLNY